MQSVILTHQIFISQISQVYMFEIVFLSMEPQHQLISKHSLFEFEILAILISYIIHPVLSMKVALLTQLILF